MRHPQVVLLALLLCACAAPDRPDVVLVTIDTLRADRLGCYGHGRDTSPRIDALAREGVVFERAIAAAGRTVPSHASIFTSQFVRGHSVGFRNGDSELVGTPVLAEHFADGGYRTGAFVGNVLLAGRLGLARGFETYDEELTTPEPNRPHVVERRADATTRRVRSWLRRDDPRPVFLWVHYQDPHGPYAPPPPWDVRFEPEDDPDEVALEVATRRARDAEAGHLPRYQRIPGLRRPSRYVALYDGEIAYADHHVGSLLDLIDARQRPTVVLLTADHGESLGEGGFWFKHAHTTTPDVAHVPMILRAPGLAPGRRAELVHHVDVLPTLLELAGLPVPNDRAGVALGTLLRGDGGLPARTLFSDHGAETAAYAGDGFLRVEGTQGAWSDDPPEPPARATRYRWRSDGSFAAEGEPVPVPPEVAGYLEHAVPMRTLPPPDAAQRARLRALGYAH